MESEKICRLCGVYSTKIMYNVFHKNENGQQLIQLIKQCLPVLIYRTDPLPKQICELCHTKVNEYSSFQKDTAKTHNNFKEKLINSIHESRVRLYFESLDISEPNQFPVSPLRSTRNCACQVVAETRTSFTNTHFEKEISENRTIPTNNLKILTPNLINEKSESSNILVSLLTEKNGAVRKKQRLAGPKSKIRMVPLHVRFEPRSLLQCALQQINRNLNLVQEESVDESSSDFTENSFISLSNRELTTPVAFTSVELHQDNPDYFSQREETTTPDFSLMEPSINISVMEHDFNTDQFEMDIDLSEPVMCNYCMKNFSNIVELAIHELQHIKVDIGPRVDTKEFSVKHRKFSGFYQNYVLRQRMGDDYYKAMEKNENAMRERRELRAHNAVRNAEQNAVHNATHAHNSTKVHSAAYMGHNAAHNSGQNSMEQNQVYSTVEHNAPQEEETENGGAENETEDNENSLLIPEASTPNNVFGIENNEVLVNGIPLRNWDKQERRRFYKNIVINGVKRKFCSLCRHTFKDNWAIENHYFSSTCQYTCKYCGRKFKFQKDLFQDHLKSHRGELCNKIFGPRDRHMRFKKKKFISNRSILVGQINTIPPKVKPIKIKHLMQKKMMVPPVRIKTEPDLPPMNESVTLEASGSSGHEPYQAYFCRKCFKVFFKVDEYNLHIQTCTGENRQSSVSIQRREFSQETSSVSSEGSKRPVRSCVKDLSHLNDSDSNSSDNIVTRKSVNKVQQNSPENGYECGICCSSFPSKHSRNSHMRIHKGQPHPQKTILNKVALKSHAIAKPPPQNPATSFVSNTQHQQEDVRFANLNPAVARLVQNNPHLTIRSYIKPAAEKHPEPQKKVLEAPQEPGPEQHIKRVYKCADCGDKFENKSILYYHKMNSCIIKRHYECAFCRKKFGTYDQYNTHMFYVHPE